MRPNRWYLVGDAVLKHVERVAPHVIRKEFRDLCLALQEGPYPGDGVPDIYPLITEPSVPNAFSVPFDDALLAYQVTLDMPAVRLLYVHWSTPPQRDEDSQEVGPA